MEIREVFNEDEKSKICLDVLHALPDWFAVEESVIDYGEQVKEQDFFAAFDEEKPVGFISLKQHNAFTAEVCVMGVLESHHRSGIGTALMRTLEDRARAIGSKFLTVKTLDSSALYAPYDRTRSFYRKVGFYPLEVFTTVWDEENPCLFMAKYLDALTD